MQYVKRIRDINVRFLKLTEKLVRLYRSNPKVFKNLSFRAASFITAGVILFSGAATWLGIILQADLYKVSDKESKLVAASTVDVSLVKSTTKGYSFNKSDDKDPASLAQKLSIAGKLDTEDKVKYQADLSLRAEDGVTFSDSDGNRKITLKPQFSLGQIKSENGRYIYPLSSNEKHIYTFKKNGIKSDIVFTTKPDFDTKSYRYNLGLGKELEVKMLPNGGVGIYSADQTLFDNIQISDDKSKDLIDQARQNGAKNNLVYELPAPFIANENESTNYQDATYSLDGQTLVLDVKNLSNLSYPLTIDPTIVLTTTTDFSSKTGSSPNTDFSSTDTIKRGQVSGGGALTTNWTNDFSYLTTNVGPNAQATGGTITIVNESGTNYVYHTFDSSGTFTPSTSLAVTYLVVAGGGGGGALGYYGPGGGGGGGVLYSTITLSTAQTVTIGAGGAVNTNGANSSLGGIVATGGGAGGNAVGSAGGSGGGGSVNYIPGCGSNGGGAGTGGQGSAGGVGNMCSSGGYDYYTGGGGGGASAAGTDGTSFSSCGGLGGNGSTYFGATYGGGGGSIWNSVQFVWPFGGASGNCSGGTGGGGNGNAAGTANTGGGGGGYAAGGSGRVVIKYVAGTTTTTSSPFKERGVHSSVAYNGYMYLLGGLNTNEIPITGAQTVVYTPIKGDGTIGAPTTPTSAFTTPRWWGRAFAYNGYMYMVGGYSGSAGLNDVQYAPINLYGTLGTWQYTFNSASSGSFTGGFATQRWAHDIVAYNGYVYVMAGYHATVDTACNGVAGNGCSDIQYAPINANGTIGTWSTTTALPAARYGMRTVAYNGFIYSFGGYTTVYTGDVLYAPLSANGTVGTWNTTTAIGFNRYDHGLTIAGGYAYIGGGNTGGGLTANIRYAPFNADGTIGAWQRLPAFATAREGSDLVYYNNQLYMIGGQTSATPTYIADVQRISIGNNGLSLWVPNGTFPVARYGHTSVAYNGYLYIIGGYSGAAFLNTVLYAPIGTDGVLGAWTTSANTLITGRVHHTSVVYNGIIYAISGQILAGFTNTVEYSTIQASGDVGAWATTTAMAGTRKTAAAAVYNGFIYVSGGCSDAADCPTGANQLNDVAIGTIATNGTVSGWAVSGNTFTTTRRAHSSVVNNGYLYIMGGCTGATCATQLSDVQYASINSSGTINAFASAGTGFNFVRDNFSATAENGALCIYGGLNGAAVASDVQCTKFNSNGTITGIWNATTTIPTARRIHAIAVYNGYAFISGGYTATPAFLDTVESVRIGPPNNPGTSYTAATSLGTGVQGAAAIASNGFIYLLGGKNTGGTNTNNVLSAPINTNGSLGSWSTANTFNVARQWHAAAAYNGYMYIMGGEHSTTDTLCNGTSSASCSDVQYAKINANGSLGSWSFTSASANNGTTFSAGFTTARYQHAGAAYGGYLYVMGGYTGSAQADVQYAALNADGTVGTWASTTSFTGVRYAHTSVIYNGYMYVLGGYSGSTFLNDVQFAPVNTDGTVGSWTNTTPFPTTRAEFTTFVSNGYIYLTAGNNGGTRQSTTRYAQLKPGGGVGEWAAGASLATARNFHSAAVYNGFYYILGGCSAGTCTTYQSDVQYAPIATPDYRARYERVVDYGATGFAVGTITVNSASRCDYTISYKLADGTGIFGSQTTVADIAPGKPLVVGSLARYLSLVVVMADDTCGEISAIDDISINFSAAPDAPELQTPINNAVGISTLPQFKMGAASQFSSTYVRYRIEVCTTSNCSSVLRTIDQNASQTGWTGQSQWTNTAYGTGPKITEFGTHNYQAAALAVDTLYYWRAYAIDPGNSNQWSTASQIYSFRTIGPPTLLVPANGATNVSTLPEFRLGAGTGNSYARYKIDVCSVSNCSSVVRTIDQTLSQTGWQSQGLQSGTAYDGGVAFLTQFAVHQYQTAALSPSTTYWWRGYVIDPVGSNVFTGASSIFSFTTGATVPNNININGGTTIQGGSTIKTQ